MRTMAQGFELVLIVSLVCTGNGCKRDKTSRIENSKPQADPGVCFEPPGWFGGGGTMLRIESPESRALLIMRRRGSDLRGVRTEQIVQTDTHFFYRFDPETRQVSQVTRKEWDGALGEVADCQKDYSLTTPFYIHSPTRGLRKGSKVISTPGKITLQVIARKGGTKAAALSCDNAAPRVPMPFMSGTVCEGQHYHQALSLADGSQIGDAVRLSVVSAEEGIGICWSVGEEYVVYYGDRSVCVVPVAKEGGSKP